MTRPALGRADLVRTLARLREGEWPAAAAALGFDPAPPKPGVRPARPAPTAAVSGPPSAEPTAPAPAPYRPTDLPDLPFWRVAATHDRTPDETPQGAPAWLTRTRPWDRLPEADPGRPIPRPAGLAPRPRQARFLRRHLATPGRGQGLDLDRLCRLLGERRVPARLPRLARPVWPGRVRVILDLSPPLAPFRADLWGWARLILVTLGGRARLLLTRSGHPADLEDAVTGAAIRLDPADGGPLAILGDAGLYAQDGPRHRHWRALALARQGSRPLLLAPCPPRYLAGEGAAGFDCVPLELGAHLRPWPRRRGGAAPDRGPWTAPVSPAAGDLLAALAAGARTEAPLLRDLRLALAGRGADIGCEYEVWNHPGVIADALACALKPAARPAAEGALAGLPADLREALRRTRGQGNRHLSPLVRLEEALAGEPQGSPGRDWARAQARRWAATLHSPDRAALRPALAAQVVGLGRRRPEALGLDPALATAWALARREELKSGVLGTLPPGVDLATLTWLLEDGAPARPAYLGQVGEALGVFPADWPRPVCRLAELEAVGDYWELRGLPDPPSPRGGTAGDLGSSPPSPPGARAGDEALAPPQLLRLGESLPLDPGRRYRLTLGRRQLDLEAVRRPPWAAGMGRDAGGLFAERTGGRRLYWPPWARDQGLDAAGRWAEFAVGGAPQRMRWIPPGQFLMGSPADEADRFGEGDWAETQHPVSLTQGFWLADTACTQALWRAVLGEEPSRFRGDERPVEQVSWDEVVQRFLPALNALVPGLNAVLPTEAQWEYACRAGTATPFSFGPNISTDQVNYDGNYPYAGAPKGQYREQTVDVKALPANAWGLYQMHGNVWEWCADWLEEYPRGPAVDPLGPSEGRLRVLRGGSWISFGRSCRSAGRYGGDPGDRYDGIGFRLARGSSPPAGGQAGSLGVAGVAAGGGAPAAAPASPRRGRGDTFKGLFLPWRKR